MHICRFSVVMEMSLVRYFLIVIALGVVTDCVRAESLTPKQEQDAVKFISQEIANVDVHDVDSLNKCLEKLIALIRPYMKYGIKKWEVPVLDPLYLKNVRVEEDNGGTKFKALFKDVLVFGLSDFQVNYIRSYPATYSFDLGLRFPDLKMLGHYDIDGKILILNIKDRGPFTANVTNVESEAKCRFKVEKGHLILQDTTADFNFKKFRFHLDNLLQGAPIGEQLNESLNKDVDDLTKELKPAFIREINKIIIQTLRKGLLNLPLAKWEAAIPR